MHAGSLLEPMRHLALKLNIAESVQFLGEVMILIDIWLLLLLLLLLQLLCNYNKLSYLLAVVVVFFAVCFVLLIDVVIVVTCAVDFPNGTFGIYGID